MSASQRHQPGVLTSGEREFLASVRDRSVGRVVNREDRYARESCKRRGMVMFRRRTGWRLTPLGLFAINGQNLSAESASQGGKT